MPKDPKPAADELERAQEVRDAIERETLGRGWCDAQVKQRGKDARGYVAFVCKAGIWFSRVFATDEECGL
jgi:hypothetical protein